MPLQRIAIIGTQRELTLFKTLVTQHSDNIEFIYLDTIEDLAPKNVQAYIFVGKMFLQEEYVKAQLRPRV